MGSTSSASTKDGERNRNMQRHVALAPVSISAKYNYKLSKDSVESAKRSQKLLCSPAVGLIPARCGDEGTKRADSRYWRQSSARVPRGATSAREPHWGSTKALSTFDRQSWPIFARRIWRARGALIAANERAVWSAAFRGEYEIETADHQTRAQQRREPNGSRASAVLIETRSDRRCRIQIRPPEGSHRIKATFRWLLP
jgi:hypothetical protein